MILGNPYNFAIFTKTIKEWNMDNEFCNGVLFFCIDGKFFPNNIVTATLNYEIQQLKEKLKNLVDDEELYNMQKDKAFSIIYNMTFPENTDIDNDYRFDISPESFADENCYIFAVGNGKQIRIMATELYYNKEEARHDLRDIKISETFIANNDLNEMITKLEAIKL